MGIYYPTTRKYDNSLARWFPVSVPAYHLAGSAFGSPAHTHSPTRKPVTPGNIPPTLDLNAAVPFLEKAFPQLQPTCLKSTPTEPVCANIDNRTNIKGHATSEHEHEPTICPPKGKQRTESLEETPGQTVPSICQTPVACTPPVFEAIIPSRMRTDSISSIHSEQSTNSFRLEYTEQQSSRKEDYVDPSISKSVKIGITSETQKQMQSAHPCLPGDESSLHIMKDFTGKVDVGRNTLPLVELDNIL